MDTASGVAAKWDAKDYAANSTAQQRWGEELIDRLALRGSEHVLDIGCGDGKLTARIAERLPEGAVVGIDSSADMIALARESYAPHESRVSFMVMDAQTIDFVDRFDAAFSNAALHWVRDHQAVLQGTRRAMHTGGRICFQMGGRGNAAQVLSVVDTLMQSPRWSGHFSDFEPVYGFHGPDEYTEWLHEANFDPQRVELMPKDMVHTQEQFEGWIRTTWLPYTRRVPEAERGDFIRELVDERLHRFPLHDDGLVHTDMVRLEVEATAR